MLLLAITHNVINRKWYLFSFKVTGDLRKFLGLIANLSLAACFLTLMISGFMISNYLSPIEVKNGFLVRQIHTLAAYWVLVLGAIHIGVYWPMLYAYFNKLFLWLPTRFHLRPTLRALGAFTIIFYGIKSSINRSMGSKLLMQHSFDYWNFEESTIGFFLTYLALMGLYICVTHYLLKWSARIFTERRSEQ